LVSGQLCMMAFARAAALPLLFMSLCCQLFALRTLSTTGMPPETTRFTALAASGVASEAALAGAAAGEQDSDGGPAEASTAFGTAQPGGDLGQASTALGGQPGGAPSSAGARSDAAVDGGALGEAGRTAQARGGAHDSSQRRMSPLTGRDPPGHGRSRALAAPHVGEGSGGDTGSSDVPACNRSVVLRQAGRLNSEARPSAIQAAMPSDLAEPPRVLLEAAQRGMSAAARPAAALPSPDDDISLRFGGGGAITASSCPRSGPGRCVQHRELSEWLSARVESAMKVFEENHTAMCELVEQLAAAAAPRLAARPVSRPTTARPPSNASLAAPAPTCALCFARAHEPVRTRCGHLFCRECIDEWLRRSPACPVCHEVIGSHMRAFLEAVTFDNVVKWAFVGGNCALALWIVIDIRDPRVRYDLLFCHNLFVRLHIVIMSLAMLYYDEPMLIATNWLLDAWQRR